MRERIKRHFSEKKHHYKVALLGIILFAIFFFAHTVGDGAYQEQSAGPVVEEIEVEQPNVSCEWCDKKISEERKD